MAVDAGEFLRLKQLRAKAVDVLNQVFVMPGIGGGQKDEGQGRNIWEAFRQRGIYFLPAPALLRCLARPGFHGVGTQAVDAHADPLIGDYRRAKDVLDDMLEQNRSFTKLSAEEA